MGSEWAAEQGRPRIPMRDAPTIIATAIGATGLALALVALGLQFKDRASQKARAKTRLRVAEQLQKGGALGAKLNGLDRTTGPWDEIEREIVAWHNETEVLLPSGFRSFFESSAGMTSFASQYKDYSRLSNHLIGRLTRLGEIIGKI
jgi:hypothetical protein